MTQKDDKTPYGYAEVTVYPRLTMEEAREAFHAHHFKLIVPKHLAEELGDMYRNRVRETRKAVEREEEEKAEAERQARDAKRANDSSSSSDSSYKRKPFQGTPDPVLDTEENIPVENFNPSEEMVVYTMAELARVQESGKRVSDSDNKGRIKNIVDKLAKRSNLRRVDAPVKALNNLRELDSLCPHFGQVIEFIKKHLVHAKANRSRPRIPPILLLGQPGVGKTYFAKELAKALESGMRHIAYDTEITNSALMGSDRRWSNTSHGALFEQIVMGEHGNPVFFLDEIDKATHYYGGNHALTSLHSLLEPVSACSVTDISLEFTFDASAVIWVCAANSTKSIPGSLLSRMEPFLIELPNAEQSLRIAESVAERVYQDTSPVLEMHKIPRRVFVQIAHLSPREQYKALSSAMTNATFNGRREVRLSDLPAHYLEDADEISGSILPKNFH